MRSLANRALEKIGFRISRVTELHPLDTVIRRHHRCGFQFVQIGANDGRQHDPISSYVRYYQWRGVLVEPVKDYYDELVANYSDCPNLKFVNAAISAEEGTTTIYRVNPARPGLPKWRQGIASLKKDHHRRSCTPDDAMISEEVPCLPLMKLFANYQIGSLDFLQVDAEGCDIEIIRSLDFNRIRPKIIHFEHRVRDKVHSREELEHVLGILVSQGYNIFVNQSDCLAYL
jgi:FkbM family methyltransferase